MSEGFGDDRTKLPSHCSANTAMYLFLKRWILLILNQTCHVSGDGDDFLDLGQVLLENALDAHFHRHRCTGATLASSLQANFHGLVGVHTDQLDVASMALQSGSDRLYDLFDLFFKTFLSVSFAASKLFSALASPGLFTSDIGNLHELIWRHYSGCYAAGQVFSSVPP